MAKIPLVQTTDRNINQLQQNIAQALEPLLSNPLLNGVLIKNITLVAGNNIVNHGLGRTLQGWSIVGINGIAGIYDMQATNPQPYKNLLLFSDANVSVTIYCF